MSIDFLTLLLFGTMALLLMLGIPLSYVLGGLALVFAFVLQGTSVIPWAIYRVWDIMGMFSLIAIPLFIFMANVLQSAGIAEDLYDAIYHWLGGLRGGLAIATVMVCTLLSAMVGTAGAGVVIMGLIALPAMLKRNYDKKLACGVIMAGGSLGVLIPPSILFILYGQFASQSVGKLFLGGVGPGLALSASFIIYILILCWIKPSAGPALGQEHRISWHAKIAYLKTLILPGFLIVAVIGSLFSGMATPSEAAGVGAIGALICAAVRRRLNWNMLKGAVDATLRAVAMIMWVVIGAYLFVGMYLLAGGDEFLRAVLFGLGLGRWGLLILIQLVLIVMGMFLDWVGILILLVPLVVPVLVSLGFDALWFGVLFNLNMQISYLSPPFGYSMFYLKGVAPQGITMGDLYHSVAPFIALQLLVLSISILFPQLALFLPSLLD